MRKWWKKTYTCIVMAALMALGYACSTSAPEGYGKAADPHDITATTEIDSLYANYLNAMNKNKLGKANAFFSALHDYEFTDSLVQFSSSDKSELVGANADYWMGQYLVDTYRPNEALDLGLDALAQATSLGDEKMQSDINSLLAACYQRLGRLEEAVRCMEKCYEYSSKVGDQDMQSSDLNNLAALSLALRHNDMGKAYIDKAIEIEKPLGRNDVLAIRYGIASEVYLALHQLDEAERFAREAYRLNKQDGLEGKAAVRQSQLAAVLMEKGKDDEAISVLTDAAPALKQAGNNYSYAIAQVQLGNLYYKKGDNDEAAKHFQIAHDITKDGGSILFYHRALQGLSKTLKDIDLPRAYDYLEKSAEIADSIYKSNNKTQLDEIEKKYEESEKLRESENRAYQQKMRFYGALGISVILLLAIIVLFIIIRSKNRTQKLQKDMEEMRTSFFTSITHEFRTPISVIQGLSQNLVEESKQPEEVAKAANVIIAQSCGLLDLVNQLLDISKLRSHMSTPDWRHGNIVSLMHMITEKYAYTAERRGIDLVFSPAENVINMDFVPDYVIKIMRNLISNALKFTHSGQRIYISTNVSSTELKIRVADDGDGIDAADLPRIFEPFYQGGTANSKMLGTGIGLSLVNQMVTTMRGTISVESAPGNGTIFTILLPISQGKELAAYDDKAYTSPEALLFDKVVDNQNKETDEEKPIVLIVEDNDSVAYLISTVLSDTYSLYFAHTGSDGLRRALDVVPDVIITDVMMPEMDGIEMSRQLKANPLTNHVPIIVISAKTDTADKVNSFNAGVDAYLTKPFSGDELVALVANLLEQRRLLCAKYQNLLEVNNEASSDMKPADRLFISNFVTAVHTLIAEEKGTDMEKISMAMNMTSRALSRKVTALTGDQPSLYVNKIKVAMAKKLMDSDPSMPVSDVAYRCGFEDPTISAASSSKWRA